MRGFASFFLGILFIAGLLALASIRAAVSNAAQEDSVSTLVLERKYYSELELKEAFTQVFAQTQAPGAGEKSASEASAADFERLEAFLEKKFTSQGIQADVWFGSPGTGGEKQMIRLTLEKSKPAKCSGCLDFGERTVDWDKRVVHKSIELVFNGRISKLGLAHTPTSAGWIGKETYFGATFFDARHKAAWVVVLGEGFGKEGIIG